MRRIYLNSTRDSLGNINLLIGLHEADLALCSKAALRDERDWPLAAVIANALLGPRVQVERVRLIEPCASPSA